MSGNESSSVIKTVDQAMDVCRQGDCFLGDLRFIELGGSLEDEGKVTQEFMETPVAGLALVSQSCDIARSCADRPSVEVCPLVLIEDSAVYAQIVASKRPRYAAIPGLSEQRLVADLDRTMTVDKSVVAGWKRTPGPSTDAEARAFARALARKLERFAFPDDFNVYVEPLSRRFTEKHGKESPEGRALRDLLEIRVLARPNWDAAQVELTFYFVRKQNQVEDLQHPWDEWKTGWLGKLQNHKRFTEHDSIITDYARMTAAEYLESDQLDLEHLSKQG